MILTLLYLYHFRSWSNVETAPNLTVRTQQHRDVMSWWVLETLSNLGSKKLNRPSRMFSNAIKYILFITGSLRWSVSSLTQKQVRSLSQIHISITQISQSVFLCFFRFLEFLAHIDYSVWLLWHLFGSWNLRLWRFSFSLVSTKFPCFSSSVLSVFRFYISHSSSLDLCLVLFVITMRIDIVLTLWK